MALLTLTLRKIIIMITVAGRFMEMFSITLMILTDMELEALVLLEMQFHMTLQHSLVLPLI